MKFSLALSTLVVATTLPTRVNAVVGSDGICRADNCDDSSTECVFTSNVKATAGELGYYTFEECGDITNPTLGMEMGRTYRFKQGHRTNWYHPLGFAYYPDGAHADVDELEPGVVPPGATDDCNTDDAFTCPAPMYFKGTEYLGSYSNEPRILAATTGEDNFGLDDYEPLFFHPITQWLENYDEFSITLNFPETAGFNEDIFYFCHIHQYMTGRIKLLKDDVAIQPNANKPEIPYNYDSPSAYDQKCGTYGLENFQSGHAECPDKFVCNVPGSNKELSDFSDCIDSMNCNMLVGMTTNVNAGTPTALFLHQMIPHHQNAVNMAKALMKTGNIQCDDLVTGDDTPEDEANACAIEALLREIINTQNHQIQTMRGLLDSYAPKYPTDDCKVEIFKKTTENVSTKGEESSAVVSSLGLAGLGLAGALLTV